MAAPIIYSTGQIARATGVHANTIRMYEAQGLLPPVERSPFGYRRFTGYHLEHVRLLRQAFKFTWLSGAIRSQALKMVEHSARSQGRELVEGAARLRILISREKQQAEEAVRFLEAWAATGETPAEPGKGLLIGSTARKLDISVDSLRNWERNGLIAVPRDRTSGYRLYGAAEMKRLLVIKGLRRARFSMNSILRMLLMFDKGRRKELGRALDQLPEDEEDIFFSTDRWLSKIGELEELAALLETQAVLLATLH